MPDRVGTTAKEYRVYLLVALVLSVPAFVGITTPWLLILTGLMAAATTLDRARTVREKQRELEGE